MHFAEKSVAIIGYFDGSAGQVASWFEKATGMRIACFIVDSDEFTEVDIEEENKQRVCKSTEFPQGGLFKGRPLIVASKWVEKLFEMGVGKVLCLDSVNKRRLANIELARANGLRLVSAIHPSALILADAHIGEGVWVNAGAIIGYKAEIGAGAIINTGAQIEHHNILEECCQVDPGVVTAGNVVLGECCHIHTGATLINRVEIGANSIVGAGAVVLKSVPANSTVAGVPARIIRSSK